ncbi:hypothetical protein GW17_00022840 [Ensete ventricosum]|nr:hypothetical protein GW17_00022840 [Ensete ventricosum]
MACERPRPSAHDRACVVAGGPRTTTWRTGMYRPYRAINVEIANLIRNCISIKDCYTARNGMLLIFFTITRWPIKHRKKRGPGMYWLLFPDGLYMSVIQREDWRLRPLSAEMIEYARNDVHYLLYIADCLVSELKRKSPGMHLLFSVLIDA